MSAEVRSALIVPPREQEIRAEARDPATSVFLSANAGSGKTTILTERVIRLLLDGVKPDRILCLTYTKSAAAEMQERIFSRLSRWVEMDDASLSKALRDLGARERGLAEARRLFAEAIETPGGLKLQTIHAFAERLLHLFPFEANVPARFEVLDDLAKGELLDEARRSAVLAAARGEDAALAEAFNLLAVESAEQGLADLLDEAMKRLTELSSEASGPGQREFRLRRALGLAPEDDEAAVTSAIIARFPPARWPDFLAMVQAGAMKKQDRTFVATLVGGKPEDDDAARAGTILDLFQTSDGGLKAAGSIVSKDVAEANPDLAAAIADALVALPALIERRRALATLARSRALWTFAEATLERFEAAKRRRGLADFDDLIRQTLRLVADPGAAWVLCKLDSAISHILVDEAQDTTPAMWRIVGALSEEFFAGAGAARSDRTLFVVGDEKQSIYSFQGASPKSLAEQRRTYQNRHRDAGLRFLDRKLQLSFRTVGDILAAVDAVFADPASRAGLGDEDVGTTHETARQGAAGFVEIWPLLADEKRELTDPAAPVDQPRRDSAQLRLAEQVAGHIAALIRTGRFDDDGAPVRPDDVMILVQTRNAFFDAVIRALKRAGVPVAGADRLKLAEQIVVLDLLAAARCALLPQDDLSIAEALKGPLIGLADSDLLALAPGRTGSLHQALADSADPAHRAAHETIERWRRLAIERAPSGFFAAILGPGGGRRALLSRLGPDAGEAIDVFLQLVHDHEVREPPSLAGFLTAFATFDGDVKRDQEQAGGAVRVMTVHGAKGLEARIVYLPDASHTPAAKFLPKVYASQGALLHAPSKKTDSGALSALRAAARKAQLEEYRRLLYVAMTRAKDRLYIGGWKALNASTETSWRDMIEAALERGCQDAINESSVAVRRWRTVTADEPPPAPEKTTPDADAALPAWIARMAPEEPLAAPPIRPSRAVDAAETASPAGATRGAMLHRLIERLAETPEVARESLCDELARDGSWGAGPTARRRLAAEALAVVRAPGAADLFGPGSQAEVAVAGSVTLPNGGNVAVSGRIDRLLIQPDRIVIADFKSGAPGPGDRRQVQLALYRELLKAIYPGRPVECVNVWTGSQVIERIDDTALDAALGAIKPA